MHNNLESLGDCIGLESCIDLKKNFEDLFPVNNPPRSGSGGRGVGHGGRGGGGGGGVRKKKLKREYPPPITSLVRTENLPSHMPWVMKRYCTDDGRLVISQEKVKRHEYFEADRSNGRLTLRLVPSDSDDIGELFPDEKKKVHVDIEESNGDSDANCNGEICCKEKNQENVEIDQTAVVGGGSGGVEWYGCEGSLQQVLCRYGMAISSTLNPVQTKPLI